MLSVQRGELAESDASLRDARAAVAAARRDEVGIYRAGDALRVLRFELRFLARRQPPDRWLVDLSDDAEVLLPPQAYPDVALPEDRLFSRPSTCRCGSPTAGSAGSRSRFGRGSVPLDSAALLEPCALRDLGQGAPTAAEEVDTAVRLKPVDTT
jgi:hypothetical protein